MEIIVCGLIISYLFILYSYFVFLKKIKQSNKELAAKARKLEIENYKLEADNIQMRWRSAPNCVYSESINRKLEEIIDAYSQNTFTNKE